VFQSSHPVSGTGFHDRDAEMARLEAFVAALRAGAGTWLALIGPRKIGKTSMILELSRRIRDVAIVAVDTQEVSPPSIEIVRVVALRAVDVLLGGELGEAIEVVAATGGDADALLDRSETFTSLPPRVKTAIRAIARGPISDELARLCLDLPERLAEALDRHVVVAVDEFQELATVPKREADPLPMIRSVWQRHRRVGYVVSGSGRSMLEDMVTRAHSPFFQHFDVMYVEPFATDDAVALLVRERIPESLARRAVATIGGHPFYLQLLGEALTAAGPPLDDDALKEALQELLFSRTGRLALYFQLGYERAVGRSGYLAAALDALADGPRRPSEVARSLGVGTADTARYLERLGDVIRKQPDGRYAIDDPVFALWLRWRRPGGTVVPMTLVGDAAERDVANLLARMGFDLVYQSRASRGSFDLLATRGSDQLGVQVKRSALPLRFDAATWKRMSADAERLGWRWSVAAVAPDGAVRFLDPARARRGKEVRLGELAVIDSLVEWLDAG